MTSATHCFTLASHRPVLHQGYIHVTRYHVLYLPFDLLDRQICPSPGADFSCYSVLLFSNP